MPHKSNPVLSVLIRRAALTAPALAATLHAASAASVDERSDGGWHAEWATLRTLTRRAVVAASQTSELLAGLQVDAERAAANLAAAGDVRAEQRAMTELTGRQAHSEYLGASEQLVDAVLQRARLHMKEATHDRSADRRHRLRRSCGWGPAVARAVARHLGERAVGAPPRNASQSESTWWAGTCPGTAAAPPPDRSGYRSLAAEVLALADEFAPATRFHYAGDSIGGAVGLQLLLDAPDRVLSATLLCTGAAIGRPEDWADRAATVRASGTGAVVELASAALVRRGIRGPQSRRRRRTAGRVARHRRRVVCAGLRGAGRLRRHRAAGRDRQHRYWRSQAPKTSPTPPEGMGRIVSGVKDGRLVVLDGVGHLAPAEAPDRVAALIAEQVRPDAYTAGMAVRREVLGDAHVDRAVAATTEFTADFQDLITRYAWGTIWTRPGLDRRSRSLITLTALVARGHHEELAMHLRAARRNGLSNDEIKELLLQTAIYCGVPDANTAFRIANQVLADYDEADR